MKRQLKGLSIPGIAATAFVLGVPLASAGGHFVEFDEFEPIIEINATDGDIGFHVLLDGEAWNRAVLFDGDGDRMLRTVAIRDEDLDEQGVTEFFIESAEPPCWLDLSDPEADEDEVVMLDEFLDRFEEGTYKARGRTLEGERMRAFGEFTHNIPAAPETEVEVEWDGDEVEVEIEFESGEDLGQCEINVDLETHPADVEVVRWEVVVEPDEDQLDGINEAREAMGEDEIAGGVFVAQLPADSDEVEVSEEWLEAYVEAGVTTFKYEVGAKEESGNQTFTEDEFDIYEDAEEDD